MTEILRVRDAWCPRHGRCRPEMLAFPFSITRAALALYAPTCPVRACEETIELDAEEVDRPEQQHIIWYQDGPGTPPRPVIELAPTAPGLWDCGVTPRRPDQPSGEAPYPAREAVEQAIRLGVPVDPEHVRHYGLEHLRLAGAR